MSSQWFYQDVTGLEHGPVSFQVLAQLAADRHLSFASAVRPDFSDEWQDLDSVVGLDCAIERIRTQRKPTTTSVVNPTVAKKEQRLPRDNKDVSRTEGKTVPQNKYVSSFTSNDVSASGVAVTAAGICCIALAAWRFLRPTRFPGIRQEPLLVNLPVFGTVNQFELYVLCANAVLLIGGLITWWFNQQRTSSRS